MFFYYKKPVLKPKDIIFFWYENNELGIGIITKAHEDIVEPYYEFRLLESNSCGLIKETAIKYAMKHEY